jgi:hypothetical protein
MADETGDEARLAPEAAAAPNRDRHDEPRAIIEGQPGSDEPDAASPPEPRPANDDALGVSSQTPRLPRRRPNWALAAGLGGLTGAIVAAAAILLATPAVDPGVASRIAALEKGGHDLASATAALEKRLAPLEASVSRLAAGSEAAKADLGGARADAAKALALASQADEAARRKPESGEETSPTSQAPAADLAAIEGRLEKFEGALAALDKSAADQVSIEDRIAKIEAALAAPKSEARVAPDTVAVKRDDWAAVAIVAEAVSERLGDGSPYGPEQAALARLRADPAKLAALATFAEKGAPTGASLAAEFGKIAPEALKAVSPKSNDGVTAWLIVNLSKVVRISPVGERAGDDPAALVSQIIAALGRGEIGPALAIWARLPEPARQASQQWAGAARARLGAEEAAQGLLSDAIAELAKRDKS